MRKARQPVPQPAPHNRRWPGLLVALSLPLSGTHKHIILLGKPPTEFHQQPEGEKVPGNGKRSKRLECGSHSQGALKDSQSRTEEGREMESRDKATKAGQNNGGMARNVTDGGRRGLKTDYRPAKKSGTSLVRNGDKQRFWKRDMRPSSASRSVESGALQERGCKAAQPQKVVN